MPEDFVCLKVTTLGRFSVFRDQEELSGGYWKRRRVCELLKILLSAEQHRQHREQVQERLWLFTAATFCWMIFTRTGPSGVATVCAGSIPGYWSKPPKRLSPDRRAYRLASICVLCWNRIHSTKLCSAN